MTDEIKNENGTEKAKRVKSPMTEKEFLQAVIMGLEEVNGMTVKAKATELLLKKENKGKSEDGEKKPSKAKTESKPLQDEIMSYLHTQSSSVPVKKIAEAVGSTSPKVNAALKFLVEDELVNKLDFGRNKPFEYIIR